MKTTEELNVPGNEPEALNRKPAGLSNEETAQVCGGVIPAVEEVVRAERPQADLPR